MAQWYYQIEGQTHGPISDRKFKRRVATGMLRPSDLVCRDGMKDWVTISSLDLMNDAEEVVPPPVRRKKKRRKSRESEIAPPPPRVLAPPPVPFKQATTFKRPVRKSDRNVLIACFVALSILFVAVLTWAIISGRNAADQSADATGETVAEKQQTAPPAKTAESKTSKVDAEANAKKADAAEPIQPEKDKIDDDKAETISDDSIDVTPKNDTTKSTTKEPDASKIDAPKTEIKTDQDVASKQPSESQTTQPKAAEPDKKRIGLQDTGVVVLYQEMDVARNPKFIVQGLPFDQELHYRVLSEFRIGKLQENGFRSVEQTVIDAKLVSADPLSRTAMGEAVTNLKGQTFTFKLNQLQEVEDFAAGKEEKKSVKIKNPFDVLNTEGFRVTSVIDQDGWKELAQLTFFVPRDQQKTWVGQMRHDWDALGSWEGETTYKVGAEQKNILSVNYAHVMKYTPPKAGGGGGGLPFEIGSANFTPRTAGGLIQYDLKAGRVATIQENFQVTGELDADVLGQKAKIQVEEQQVFTLRLLDQNPWQQ